MHARQINWMLVATIFLVCFSWGMAPAAASAQDYRHINECKANTNSQTQAMQRGDYALTVSLARWILTNCRDLFRGPDDEALMLWGLSYGLLGQGNFEDAIPIAERCVTIKPDAADCFVSLGSAFQGLGRFVDARKAWERAISIGGYDQLNAAAVGIAHRLLAQLPPENKPTQSNSSRDGEANNQEWEEVPAPPPATETKRFGTGFVVSAEGQILSNNHVVAGCRTLTTRDGKPLQVLSRNVDSDLALLQTKWWQEANRPVAVFRTGPAPKLGDAVVAFGFPLPGVLSSEGNVSTGILSATSGLGNDVRFIQISAPVQPGNSGGPLFDSSGHVIGVVVAKLDAVKIAQATGDIPQNVNFAVQWSAVRAFLDEANVPYQKEASLRATPTRNIAAAAERIAVTIECTE
jgi:S1-C subfamily serine protease